jgi:UDP-glucose 4-epimerase
VASPSHERSIAHELEVIGTMHVLNALSQSNVRKLIAISTTAVYGATPKNPNFLTEDIPLMQNMESRFIRDKIDAELQIKRFKEKYPDRTVTVLRMASVLGPRVSTYLSRFLSRQVVPVIMGYDPLMQFMHEDDAVRAFELSIINEFDGVFNIVPEGVMPLTHVLAIGGRIPLPVPHILAYPLGQALWRAKIIEVPASILDYLRYLWVADGTKAKQIMGFIPRYSTRKTVEIFYQVHQNMGPNGREETIR